MTEPHAPTTPFVPEAFRPQAPDRLSMSYLRNAGRCLLMAKADRDAGSAAGEMAAFGRLFHEVAGVCGFVAHMHQADRIDTTHALRIAHKVLADPEENAALPIHHHDELLAMVDRWASTATFDTRADTYAVEVGYRHELPGTGRTLSARVDRLEINDNVAHIVDYKTGPGLPSQETVEEGHQPRQYAWHVWQAHPYVDTFLYDEEYVRRGRSIPVYLELDDVLTFDAYARELVARVDRAYAEGEFPVTVGSWCTTCPAARDLCPVPATARPTYIASDEQAAQVAARYIANGAVVKTDEDALRHYLGGEHHPTGFIVVGDQRIGFTHAEQSELDKQALKDAGIDLDEYRRKVPASRWGKRKATDLDRAAGGTS